MTAIAVTPPRRGLVHQAGPAGTTILEGWTLRGVRTLRYVGTTLCGRRFSGWAGAEAAFGRAACGDCAHFAEREAAR